MKVYTDKKAEEVIERVFNEFDVRESAEILFSDIEFKGEYDFVGEWIQESCEEHHEMLLEHFGEKRLKQLFVAKIITEICKIMGDEGYKWRATPYRCGWEAPEEWIPPEDDSVTVPDVVMKMP